MLAAICDAGAGVELGVAKSHCESDQSGRLKIMVKKLQKQAKESASSLRGVSSAEAETRG